MGILFTRSVGSCSHLAIPATAIPGLGCPRIGVAVLILATRDGAYRLRDRPSCRERVRHGLASKSRHALLLSVQGKSEAAGETAAVTVGQADVGTPPRASHSPSEPQGTRHSPMVITWYGLYV